PAKSTALRSLKESISSCAPPTLSGGDKARCPAPSRTQLFRLDSGPLWRPFSPARRLTLLQSDDKGPSRHLIHHVPGHGVALDFRARRDRSHLHRPAFHAHRGLTDCFAERGVGVAGAGDV